MRILFALPGLHRVHRGAEIAFESVAHELAAKGNTVEVIGSGYPIPGRAYQFRHLPAIDRHHFDGWPKVPFLRTAFGYEDLSFAAALLLTRLGDKSDITITCNYPYTQWALRIHNPTRYRPAHVFVTQNGDWPACRSEREYRFFKCDGLICTNPIYWERNRKRWFSALIPNGIDPQKFHPGEGDRLKLGLPTNGRIILMVCALYDSKRVLEGLRAVSKIKDVYCVVAGAGPLQNEVDQLGSRLLPGRFMRRVFPHDVMPVLYRSADVFLHIAIREPFGNVYIEALASGVPVVAHDDEVTRWILKEHACLIDTTVEQNIVEALNDALKSEANATKNASEFARSTYSWPVVAAQYENFLGEVGKVNGPSSC